MSLSFSFYNVMHANLTSATLLLPLPNTIWLSQLVLVGFLCVREKLPVYKENDPSMIHPLSYFDNNAIHLIFLFCFFFIDMENLKAWFLFSN